MKTTNKYIRKIPPHSIIILPWIPSGHIHFSNIIIRVAMQSSITISSVKEILLLKKSLDFILNTDTNIIIRSLYITVALIIRMDTPPGF